MKPNLICFGISFFLSSLLIVSCGQAASCTAKDAEAADLMIDQLNTWESLQIMAGKFAKCDDGSIAEGNSEAVARLLVDNWQALPSLYALTKKNKQLRSFVLRHIDSTLDTEDLMKIKKQATIACPAQELIILCKDIELAATKAAK